MTNQKHMHLMIRSVSTAWLKVIQSKYLEKNQKTFTGETQQTHQLLLTTQHGNKTNEGKVEIFEIFQLKPNAKSSKVQVLVNSKPVSMEIDTGAITLYGNKDRVNPTSTRIRTYTGEIINTKVATRSK